MEIEIAEAGHMTQSGSSLLRLIQNNDMPILDLFVRESIQNSLDAAISGSKYVTVQYVVGKFDSRSFQKELHGISNKLAEIYPGEKYDYIAIRDTNTVGLTGPMRYEDIESHSYGNLLKLVYEISKPQDAAGAGGSWGLGKTVYFRVGMGLVLYYSRIKTQKGYQSRLAVTLVEDETLEDALLPLRGKGPARGIAWWGESIDENKTQPITDEDEIAEILSEFHLPPLTGNQTGTTVIIPYVNKKELLENNSIEYLGIDGTAVVPYWRKNIEDYLKMAVQRWYAPRLNNSDFNGCYLRAMINEDKLNLSAMEPVFQLTQALYNRAHGNPQEDDFLHGNEETNDVGISLRSVFSNGSKAGTLAYTVVDREALGMNYPTNNMSPYVYINNEIRDKEVNPPVIFYCRKPGMVVSYESSGKWIDGVPSTDANHFIFASFVLNSNNSFVDKEISLEEYVRKSEMADHTGWGDWSVGNYNPRVISKIQTQICKRLTEAFGSRPDKVPVARNSGLSRLFGEMLLPPQGFGSTGSPTAKPEKDHKEQISKVKSVLLSVLPDDTSYSEDGMISVHLNLKSKKPINRAEILLGIESENGIIKTDAWESQMGLALPVSIESAWIAFSTEKNVYEGYEGTIDNDWDFFKGEPFSVAFLRSAGGKGMGIKFSADNGQKINAIIVLNLRVQNREIKSTFYLAGMEEEK